MVDEDGFIVEVVEDLWDCSSCGRAGVPGRELSCPGCANGREQGEAYRDGNQRAVTDPALLALAEAGANWVCPFCSMDNRAASTACQRCAAARADRKPDATPPAAPDEPRPAAAPAAARAPGGFWRKVAKLVAVVVVLAGVSEAWDRRTRSGVIHELSWQRYIHVEHLVPVVEEAWDKAPEDARVLENKVVPDGGGYRTEVVGHRPDVERWTEKEVAGEESYTENQRVADGEETYHLTERVPDGTTTTQRTVQAQTGTRRVLAKTERLENGFTKNYYKEVPVFGSKTIEETVPKYREVQVQRTRTRYKHVPVTRKRAIYKNVEKSRPIQVPITKQVPVPRTRVRYELRQWERARTVDTQGGVDQEPYWGTLTLKGEPTPEREHVRGARYIVLIRHGDSTHEYSTPDQSEYRRFKLGATQRFKLRYGFRVELVD